MSTDPRQVAVAEAERVAGRRIDRRRAYSVIDGKVCIRVTFSTDCSGCVTDDFWDGRLLGCHECGFTCRRRVEQWVPLHDSRDTGTAGGGA